MLVDEVIVVVVGELVRALVPIEEARRDDELSEEEAAPPEGERKQDNDATREDVPAVGGEVLYIEIPSEGELSQPTAPPTLPDASAEVSTHWCLAHCAFKRPQESLSDKIHVQEMKLPCLVLLPFPFF